MKIRQLGSSMGAAESHQHLTTFVINDSVAIDAGCLGLVVPIAVQRNVKQLLISHSHIDHVASLPMFLENVFQQGYECPKLFASRDVQQSLSNDLFNDRLWPNLSRIGTQENRFFEWEALETEIPVQMAGLTITPVAVDHVIPTLGFLIEDDRSAVVISSDTGPTARLWELARQSKFREKLRAVFLECSFPNDHEWLADASKHLCTRLFANELTKISSGPPFITVAVHLKAAMFNHIREELLSLQLGQLQIGGRDRTWEF